jgi:hypothetical protein
MDTGGGGCLRSLGVVALVMLALIVGCAGPQVVSPAPGSRQPAATAAVVPATSPRPATSASPVPAGTNLIQNAGGDLADTSAACSLAGWSGNGQLQAVAYGSHSGEPTPTSPGPPDRGACYLRMAIGSSASVDPISQTIDISASSADIDAGRVAATLSGWFGGQAGAHYDYNVKFFDATGDLIDVMTAQAIDMPAGPTALAFSTASMPVPAGTYEVEVDLSLNQDSDCSSCTSVAYADSLSLLLGGG